MRVPEDDYGWTEYMRDTEKYSVDGISVCEAHRGGDEYIHSSARHTLASVDTDEDNIGPENRMVDKLDCAIKTTCLNKNRQDTVLLDSIDVHKGYTDPNNSTPPNTSPSDDCMPEPASVSSDNTLLGDCGVKKIKVDTREPEDDYG